MVISVTGKSGVGKTKLVKVLYEKPATKRYFEVKAWVTCAPDLSASNIMNLILVRLVEGPLRCPKGDLGTMLQEELKNKKYLLVIDGEVSSMEWSYMLDFLPTERAKSRVVRITQATDLDPPPACFKSKTIKLDHFEEAKTAVNLFLATLFMDKEEKYCGSLIEEAVRRKHAQFIFNVTGGLPLAIVLLSGLLRTKEYPGEWEKVFKHLEGKSSESKWLDNILSMCFDDLPHDLKSCFLYFAGFPASTLVKARSLVCEWMAEGFLRPKEGKTMEKVGERYLHELIHRRLTNLPPLENAAPGDQRVTVQTRVHDFLVLEAKEANFVEIHHGDDLPTLATARRLSLQNHTDKYAALADPLPKLRSIMANFEKEEPQGPSKTKEDIKTNDGACSPFSKKADSSEVMRKLLLGSRFLRVIYLDGLEIGNKLPSEIGSVVHLQYLGITSCSLCEVPASVGKLTGLQTLDVRGTMVTNLPSEFWKIRTLRHVFGSIVLLRRVSNLEHLQTLQAVKPGDDGGSWDATTFASMKRLQSLYIWGLTYENVHALAPVYDLKYLVLLSIGGEVISLDLFARSKYTRLQVMVLNGKITPPLQKGSDRFYFPTLTKLSPKSTKVSQDFIDKLSQQLPLLASLSLFPESYEGECLSLTDGFQSLKELKLDVDVKKIIIMGRACLNLVKLEISMYPWDVSLQVRPDIEEIIKLQDEFLYANMTRSNAVKLV